MPASSDNSPPTSVGKIAAFYAGVRTPASSARGLDYSKSTRFENVALYTPALSEGYISGVERLRSAKLDAIANGDPSLDPLAGFDFTAEDLKLTNPNSNLCFYPWLLFSAGQGAKTPTKALQSNWLIQRPRDPRVVLLGDSGGFQIQQQSIGFDPSETPQRMLEWLERVADQAMILDFPTGGIESGAATPHADQLFAEGFDVYAEAKSAGFSSDYVACLERTLRSNAHFVQHRTPGATKLLNVIQGRNDAESQHWYEQVRDFPFDGWAFAGKHSTILSMTLRRLAQMKADKLLRPGQWMHFLGISTLSVGVALTYLQRALREHTPAHDIQLSFDSKSPVDGIIFGYQAVAGFDFSVDRWSFRTEKTGLEEH